MSIELILGMITLFGVAAIGVPVAYAIIAGVLVYLGVSGQDLAIAASKTFEGAGADLDPGQGVSLPVSSEGGQNAVLDPLEELGGGNRSRRVCTDDLTTDQPLCLGRVFDLLGQFQRFLQRLNGTGRATDFVVRLGGLSQDRRLAHRVFDLVG